jgi:hypothetical protein
MPALKMCLRRKAITTNRIHHLTQRNNITHSSSNNNNSSSNSNKRNNKSLEPRRRLHDQSLDGRAAAVQATTGLAAPVAALANHSTQFNSNITFHNMNSNNSSCYNNITSSSSNNSNINNNSSSTLVNN